MSGDVPTAEVEGSETIVVENRHDLAGVELALLR
jgi:hypothetical protein